MDNAMKSLDAILDAMAAPQSVPPVERTVRRERRTFYLQGIMETPRSFFLFSIKKTDGVRKEKYFGGQISFRLDLWVEISSGTVNVVRRCVCLARYQGSNTNSKITSECVSNERQHGDTASHRLGAIACDFLPDASQLHPQP
ncbi:hypothetical protein V1477_007696 [Vespula maculifrons]|uniref:Uncharacterized protein n=1 Tax=Vespula maculifrons TaxID=7453 RepID=A0ABD2CFJ2_VESMC